MPEIRDLTGQKFNRLTVLFQVPKPEGSHRIRWLCECECLSRPKVYVGQALVNGNTKSCGCLKKEQLLKRKFAKTHGMSKKHEFLVWSSIKRRIANVEEFDALARPRRVPKLWPAWESFDQFLADMGKCPQEGAKLRRRHNSQDYTPETCYWQPPQRPERQRLPATYMWKGNACTISSIAKEAGLQRATLSARLHRGMTIEEAIQTPTDREPKRKAYPYQGELKTLGELARLFKVPYGFFFHRVVRLEMTVEQAVATIKRPDWAKEK